MSYRTDYTDLQENGEVTEHAHVYTQSVTREPNCCFDGILTNTCLCGNTYPEKIPQTNEHTFRMEEYQGYTVLICNNTGVVKQINDSHSHRYISSVIDPTCVSSGYTSYKCSQCDDGFTANEVDPLGHSYQSMVVDPTETEQGYTEYVCSICGDTYRDSYTDVTETE
jgi:DNA-directed RNA polymerase subunit RPC12/RpoP